MKIIILLFSLLLSITSWSQKTIAISAAEKKALVDSIKKRLERYYVLPDKGNEMGQYLLKRFNAKAYDAISDYHVFLDTLAADIDKVHRDPHLRLGFDPGYVQHLKERTSKTLPSPERVEAEKAFYRKNNYGFARVEMLPGNIGYLAITEFAKLNEESKATVAAAFDFMAHTDAVIMDLRNNTGGQPDMVQEVLSYFFEQPVHTSSTYDREIEKTVANYSLATVKGRKMPTKKLYILTSGNTFSAGEALPYFMKHLKRAVVVGEVTAGAAHGMKGFVVTDQVVMEIPYMRGFDPVTKSDWEGVGVLPDVVVEADKALPRAQEIILEGFLATVKDPGQSFALQWALVAVKAQLNPVTINDQRKKDYTGVYGIRTIFIEDGHLMFQRGNGPKRKLVALTEDTFELEGVANYRLRFVRNSDGNVDKIIGATSYNVTTEFLRETNTTRAKVKG